MTDPRESLCECGHPSDWHSHNGSGDCEHDGKCGCKKFVAPGVANHDIARDFPLLWEKAQEFDFAERLGGCTDPLMVEIDNALWELWAARCYFEDAASRA